MKIKSGNTTGVCHFRYILSKYKRHLNMLYENSFQMNTIYVYGEDSMEKC